MITHFIFLPFDSGKRHSVVSRDDNQCVVKFAALFQFPKHSLQVAIKVLDFQCIVQHVVSHNIIVWPESRNLINVA